MLIFAAITMTLCPVQGVRQNCIVDGDTGWFGRQKWRFENVDTPEIGDAKCAAELALALRARDRLLVLVNSGPMIVETFGYDRMPKPRLLVRLRVRGRDLGEWMVAEGLARPYAGGRRPWCPNPTSPASATPPRTM